MNPPVDAPASSAVRAATSMANRSSAPASLSPPRLTKREGGASSSIGSAAATIRLGLSAGVPATVTRPESITSNT